MISSVGCVRRVSCLGERSIMSGGSQYGAAQGRGVPVRGEARRGPAQRPLQTRPRHTRLGQVGIYLYSVHSPEIWEALFFLILFFIIFYFIFFDKKVRGGRKKAWGGPPRRLHTRGHTDVCSPETGGLTCICTLTCRLSLVCHRVTCVVCHRVTRLRCRLSSVAGDLLSPRHLRGLSPRRPSAL